VYVVFCSLFVLFCGIFFPLPLQLLQIMNCWCRLKRKKGENCCWEAKILTMSS
jgi:hypothetical protein